jgi:hypothetical protein
MLPDCEFVNAFLLGFAIRTLVASHDAGFVDRFLARLLAQGDAGRFDDEGDFGMKSFRGQIHAFRKGFIGNDAWPVSIVGENTISAEANVRAGLDGGRSRARVRSSCPGRMAKPSATFRRASEYRDESRERLRGADWRM